MASFFEKLICVELISNIYMDIKEIFFRVERVQFPVIFTWILKRSLSGLKGSSFIVFNRLVAFDQCHRMGRSSLAKLLCILPYLPYIFGQTDLSKQYRPR